MTDTFQSKDIPIIDFSLFETNRPLCAQQIKLACENLGFFYLKNHGFNEKDVEDTFHYTKLYFDQPHEEKQNYKINEHYYGYIDLRQELLDLETQKIGDHKESFNFSKFDDNDDPLAQTLPPLFNEKKSLYSSLSKKCHQLCLKLLQALAIALEIPQSEGGEYWFESKHSYDLKSGDCLRLIHYPPTVVKNDQKDIRAGSHSDYGSMTVLFQKEIGGLEILPHNSTEWVPVPIIPNHVVINVADCLQFWSKGLFKSIKHRVIFREDTCNLDRYSIAYFFHAGSDIVLDRIPSKLIPKDDDNTKYITAGEHLQNKLNISYQKVY
ncbi:27360_t:CDS:2 [Dentiscutata erythropus]|uniref:27360_t:CDS:1 n=1 Tax=Dentiscutata erythropus TaxID=1348616 RepID=A0A9N9IP77_9GLOM|nr:27360_t:CDS:2 [Dentiscutata erythropus]